MTGYRKISHTFLELEVCWYVGVKLTFLYIVPNYTVLDTTKDIYFTYFVLATMALPCAPYNVFF